MKKALLIGINRYQLPGNNLSGCVNDVAVYRGLLTNLYGYKTEDIKILIDANATKANIIAGLHWLIGTKAEEMFLAYSGHGTQFFDQNTNKNDQALCPSDVHDLRTLIPDIEIASILSGLPQQSRLSFIADCCHSGTIDREFIMGNPRVWRPKSMIVPGIARPEEGMPQTKGLTLQRGIHALLSGCRDDQTSADAWFKSTANGALTYGISQMIKKNPRQTWTQLHVSVTDWLTRQGFEQSPQLSGPDSMLKSPIF